jgi:hypothetical protein
VVLWEARFSWDAFALVVIYLDFLSSVFSSGVGRRRRAFEKYALFLFQQFLSLPGERKFFTGI